MRILLLSQFYPPVIGGVERHVRNLGTALAECLPCATDHYGAVKATATTFGNRASSCAARRGVDRFIAVSHAVARHTGLTKVVIPNFVPDNVGVLGPSSTVMPAHQGAGEPSCR
jgi:hypothetical protein